MTVNDLLQYIAALKLHGLPDDAPVFLQINGAKRFVEQRAHEAQMVATASGGAVLKDLYLVGYTDDE